MIGEPGAPREAQWRDDLRDAAPVLEAAAAAIGAALDAGEVPALFASDCTIASRPCPRSCGASRTCASSGSTRTATSTRPRRRPRATSAACASRRACGRWDAGFGGGVDPARVVLSDARDLDAARARGARARRAGADRARGGRGRGARRAGLPPPRPRRARPVRDARARSRRPAGSRWTSCARCSRSSPTPPTSSGSRSPSMAAPAPRAAARRAAAAAAAPSRTRPRAPTRRRPGGELAEWSDVCSTCSCDVPVRPSRSTRTVDAWPPQEASWERARSAGERADHPPADRRS